MITRPEADHIAGLLRTIRPHWDHLAIMTVLTSIDGDLADVAHAAIRTAEDPSMRTPQSLAFVESPHWRATYRQPTEPDVEQKARLRVRQQEIARCGHCDQYGRQSNGFLCPHEDPAERAARVKAWADKARAQIRPAPQPTKERQA